MASTDEYLVKKIGDERHHFSRLLASMAASFTALAEEYDSSLDLGAQSERFQRCLQSEGEATVDLLVHVNRLHALEGVPRVG